jgi:hypothetical protein
LPAAAALTEKRCPVCKEVKPTDQFKFIKKKKAFYSFCRPCDRNYARRYRYLPKYGLKLEALEAMLEAQGGGCAICLTKLDGVQMRGGHVDHCHTAGKVRGILCQVCNTALGKFRDNPEIMRRAANYVEAGGF